MEGVWKGCHHHHRHHKHISPSSSSSSSHACPSLIKMLQITQCCHKVVSCHVRCQLTSRWHIPALICSHLQILQRLPKHLTEIAHCPNTSQLATTTSRTYTNGNFWHNWTFDQILMDKEALKISTEYDCQQLRRPKYLIQVGSQDLDVGEGH